MLQRPLTQVHDAVVLYPCGREVPDHEAVIHRDIAMRLADLMDIPFQGTYDSGQHRNLRCYFVPSDTLLGGSLKDALGVRSEHDLFGGYADHAFMPTKAITHGLVGPQAVRPAGWSEAFSHRVAAVTLPGHTAFSRQDARIAASRLLEQGPVRLKPVAGRAGRGQRVLTHPSQVDQALSQLDESELLTQGVVLEAHLDQVATYSVGQVRLPGITASYIGTQRLTADNHGTEVYGGSRLQFARGGYDALQNLPLDDDHRQAVELARQYDDAADACYPAFFASRRNYDVASGKDGKGRTLMGVLEQSWRIGGASRAEIGAIEVLAADDRCQGLWAETLEIFGDQEEPPAHAVETFAGTDPQLGLIRKYVMVDAYGNEQHDR